MPFLSLFSNNLPDFFVIARDFADIAKIDNDQDRHKATFEWTGPNLRVGETGQLRQAPLPEGFVLHVAPFDEFRIHIKFFDGIVDPARKEEVRRESTFRIEKGLIDPNQFSFRSVAFPDLFIRHRDFKLFAEEVNSPDELQSATFRPAAPLLV